MKPTAIYIHIPFCDHKCIYCDFYSIINYKDVDRYLTALKKEIKIGAAKYAYEREIISIFFGGGTPSFMSVEYLSEILTCIKENFTVSEDAEVTIETNPGTVNKEKLSGLRRIGINRISIGIQSFDDDELKFLTRIHDSKNASNTVLTAKVAGFDNISIDLIFNLPGQSKEKWKRNLENAVKLPITHISAYSLILERGTILNKMVLDGRVKMQDEDHDADLYEYTIDYLYKNGFIQYEVSNFSLKDKECVHNNVYWRYQDYLGFGTSAHSFIDGRRWWNYSALNFYLEKMKSDSVTAGDEILSVEQMHDEYIMLAMRSKGLDVIEYKRKFGDSFFVENKPLLDSYLNQGYLVNQHNFIKFTPKGYALCDEIIKQLL